MTENVFNFPDLASFDMAEPDMNGAQADSILSRHQFVNWHEAWKQQPEEVNWLVEPLLEIGTLNSMYGAPGAGKSLVSLEIALRVVRIGKAVLYIDRENRKADHVDRLSGMGATPDELDKLYMMLFPDFRAMDTKAGGVEVFQVAKALDVALVIIDTAGRFVDGSEQDADTYHSFYNHTLAPLKAENITVLRLDHEGKDASRGERGTSAKRSDVDTCWHISKEGQKDRLLTREKSRGNYGTDRIQLVAEYEPFRHVWHYSVDGQRNQSPRDCINDHDVRVKEAVSKLDQLEIPLDWGREKAQQKIMETAGTGVNNNVLAEALRQRRVQAGTGNRE